MVSLVLVGEKLNKRFDLTKTKIMSKPKTRSVSVERLNLRRLRRERRMLVKRMKKTTYLSTYSNLSMEHDILTKKIQEAKLATEKVAKSYD